MEEPKEEVSLEGRKHSGEIRLSLSDYHDMLLRTVQAERRLDSMQGSLAQIRNFITFLRKKEGFEDVIEEFNKNVSGVQVIVTDTGMIDIVEKTNE